MFGISTGKVVGTGEVFLGAHVDIAVLLVVEHRINGLDGRNAYRPWRQPFVLLCIVGALYFQMLIVDAAKGEIANGKLHRRVGLQGHANL